MRKDGLRTLLLQTNSPSAQKQSSRLVSFTAVDRSLMVCGGDASHKNSHASQLTTNNYEPSSNCLLSTTFKDILQKETAVNFLKGKEFYKNSRQSYRI